LLEYLVATSRSYTEAGVGGCCYYLPFGVAVVADIRSGVDDYDAALKMEANDDIDVGIVQAKYGCGLVVEDNAVDAIEKR
jgi:hypothetical protein